MQVKPDFIIRVEHSRENPYLQVCRKTIRDSDLDLQALGLLVFLLDKPVDWRVRPEALARERGLTRATTYRIIDRLIKAGYIHREISKRRVPKGAPNGGNFQTVSMYIVFEDKEYRREWLDEGRFERRFDGIPF